MDAGNSVGGYNPISLTNTSNPNLQQVGSEKETPEKINEQVAELSEQNKTLERVVEAFENEVERLYEQNRRLETCNRALLAHNQHMNQQVSAATKKIHAIKANVFPLHIKIIGVLAALCFIGMWLITIIPSFFVSIPLSIPLAAKVMKNLRF